MHKKKPPLKAAFHRDGLLWSTDLVEADRCSNHLFWRASYPKTVSHFSGCALICGAEVIASVITAIGAGIRIE
jgi:hypothetical protein